MYCAGFTLISCAGILVQENTFIYIAMYSIYSVDILDAMYLQCIPVCAQ